MARLTDSDFVQDDTKWKTYKENADKYLSRFKGTPLTGEILTNSAKKAYETHGVDVPVELVLSQGQFETQMGTKGRNPSTNPFNVYEYDAGTKKRFKNIDEGVGAYYDLMARKYLKGKKLDDLLRNFVNTEGLRYASDKDYEKKVGGQIATIRRFIGSKPSVSTQEIIPDDFKSSFADARKQGLDIFIWNGKKYTTKVK